MRPRFTDESTNSASQTPLRLRFPPGEVGSSDTSPSGHGAAAWALNTEARGQEMRYPYSPHSQNHFIWWRRVGNLVFRGISSCWSVSVVPFPGEKRAITTPVERGKSRYWGQSPTVVMLWLCRRQESWNRLGMLTSEPFRSSLFLSPSLLILTTRELWSSLENNQLFR